MKKRLYYIMVTGCLLLSLIAGCGASNVLNQEVSDNSVVTSNDTAVNTDPVIELNNCKATITYRTENPKCAYKITITDEKSEKTLQQIELTENEKFTQSAAYAVDVTFDEQPDLLIPYQQTASAVYFKAYVWSEENHRFIYAPFFENLPNFIIDKENTAILSSRTASQITSYSMSCYDNEAEDFRMTHSLYCEQNDDQEWHFVEQDYNENNVAVTIKDVLVACCDGLDIDKSDPQIAPYFAPGSLWDLSSEKWKTPYYKP